MKVFKIIFTQLTKPTKSVCQERNTGRWHHFYLNETGTDEGSLWLTQHLNLKCPTNPNAFQPSAVQSWKQPKPGPSRSICVQPPDLPERATRRAGNTGQARYESSFKRAAGAGIDGGTRCKTQRTKYWSQYLENLPSPCRFCQLDSDSTPLEQEPSDTCTGCAAVLIAFHSSRSPVPL